MLTEKASCVSKVTCTSAKSDAGRKHQSAQSLSHSSDKKVLFFNFFSFPSTMWDYFKKERKILIFKHSKIKGWNSCFLILCAWNTFRISVALRLSVLFLKYCLQFPLTLVEVWGARQKYQIVFDMLVYCLLFSFTV